MTRLTADLDWADSLGYHTCYNLGGDGPPIWVVEVDETSAAIIDLVRVPDVDRSMLTLRANWPPAISAAAERSLIADFVRYREVLDDPEVPMGLLIVVTNSEETIPLIAAAFTAAGLDGRALVTLSPDG